MSFRTAFHYRRASVRKHTDISAMQLRVSYLCPSMSALSFTPLCFGLVLCVCFVRVCSGKVSVEFNLPSTRGLPVMLCFSIISKTLPSGLKLQAQYSEERTHWISQLKQAFVVRSTSSGSRTPSIFTAHHGHTTSQLPSASALAELTASGQATSAAAVTPTGLSVQSPSSAGWASRSVGRSASLSIPRVPSVGLPEEAVPSPRRFKY